LSAIASGGKLQVAWPGVNCKEKLKGYKILVMVDKNNWNVTLNNIQRPLVKVVAGVDISILACIGLNKIHMTYHGDKSKPKDVNIHQDSNLGEDSQSDSHAFDTDSDGIGRRPRKSSQKDVSPKRKRTQAGGKKQPIRRTKRTQKDTFIPNANTNNLGSNGNPNNNSASNSNSESALNSDRSSGTTGALNTSNYSGDGAVSVAAQLSFNTDLVVDPQLSAMV
jgi:hypothetical protein